MSSAAPASAALARRWSAAKPKCRGQAIAVIERALEDVSEILRPIFGNFAGICATLLRLEILFRHLTKRTIEHGNTMLHPKPDVGILIERTVASRLPICRVE